MKIPCEQGLSKRLSKNKGFFSPTFKFYFSNKNNEMWLHVTLRVCCKLKT